MFNISTLLKLILLAAILFVAFWIRIQSTTAIPEGHFTGVDAYLYYWQGLLISEDGNLPARDMHRWLPFGRDLGQILNLYSYALAYSHKAVAWLFPKVTLYDVALYMPVICFCIGLGALCLYLIQSYGPLFSGIVCVLLATLPGAINRSTAGFSDRDSWCLMLGILAITTYLAALQAEKKRNSLFWTLVSGFTVFLGGISWEGFGVFLGVILFVEIWRFLSSETEEGLGVYLLWVCTFVPTLYLAAPAYRSGQGLAKHLFAFVLVPPVVLLGIRALRYLLTTSSLTRRIKGFRFADKLRPHARTIALALTLASVALAIGYVLIQRNTFAETTVPLSQNALMQNVGELKDTDSSYWMMRYGYIFVLSIMGVIISAMSQWKNHGILLVIPFTLFIFTTFFREYPDRLWGTQNNNILFFFAIAATAMTLMFIAWRLDFHLKNELVYVAAISWFLIWTSLSRDAERYSIFTSPVVAFFTAVLIQFCSVKLSEGFRRYLPWPVVKAGIAIILLAAFMWLPSPLGYAQNILHATHRRRSKPIYTTVAETFKWMKAQLPNTAVVAGDWIHGSQLNVLGGVKTITDQDHFIQHWIHLYYRYLFSGHSEKEALEFLKTHKATHLMITEVDIVGDSPVYSLIGSHSEQDESFEIIELRDTIREKEYLLLFSRKRISFFNSIQININPENNTLISAIVVHQNGRTANIPYVAFYDKKRKASNNQDASKTGGIILYFDEQQKFQRCYYIPPIAWDNFAIRLFLRGIPSDAFKLVYEIQKTRETDVKVWEIHYPSDIQLNPKYLKTGFREIDAHLQLQ